MCGLHVFEGFPSKQILLNFISTRLIISKRNSISLYQNLAQLAPWRILGPSQTSVYASISGKSRFWKTAGKHVHTFFEPFFTTKAMSARAAPASPFDGV